VIAVEGPGLRRHRLNHRNAANTPAPKLSYRSHGVGYIPRRPRTWPAPTEVYTATPRRTRCIVRCSARYHSGALDADRWRSAPVGPTPPAAIPAALRTVTPVHAGHTPIWGTTTTPLGLAVVPMRGDSVRIKSVEAARFGVPHPRCPFPRPWKSAELPRNARRQSSIGHWHRLSEAPG